MITRGFGVAGMRPREMLHPLKMAKLREMVYSASSKAMGHPFEEKNTDCTIRWLYLVGGRALDIA